MCAVSLLGGCAQDEMTWSGTPADWVSIDRTFGGSPVVSAFNNDGVEYQFLIDTGHPGALIADATAFPYLNPVAGFDSSDFEMFGMQFRDVPVHLTDRVSYERMGFHGILGSELLENFALDLDYVEQRAALSEAESIHRIAAQAEVDEPIEISLRRTGLDQSRLALNTWIEGREIQSWLDTGAAFPVAYSTLQSFLNLDTDRPRLGGISALTTSGITWGYVTRVGSMSIGLPSPAGDDEEPVDPADQERLELASIAAMVFPNHPEPDDIFSHRLGISLGTSVLERYVVRIDYKREALTLYPHQNTEQFLANPWRDLGFAMQSDADGYIVQGAWQGTEAADADLEPGDRVLAIDGVSLSELSWKDLVAVRNGYEVDERIDVELSREGVEPWTVELPVVDWLPDYLGTEDAAAEDDLGTEGDPSGE